MRISLAGLIGLTLLLAGTFGHAEQQTGSSTHVETKSKRGYTYQLMVASEHMEAMKPLPAVLKVTDPSGNAVTGATVTCSLTMPAMAMPLNTPTFKWDKELKGYQGVVLLTMGGLWHMETTLVFPDGSQDTGVLAFSATAPNAGDDSVNKKLEDLFHQQNSDKPRHP